MKHRTKKFAAALCMLLMMLAMQTATAGAWGKYPSFPVIFTLNGEESLFPCELQAFLVDGWEIYDRPTGDHMVSYEIVDGFEEWELILRKKNQQMDIVIRNNIGHELEVKECDVMEIRVSDYSFSQYDAPDIEIFGLRPGMKRSQVPKWLREERDFTSDGVKYSVFSGFGDHMLAMIDSGYGDGGSIYYSWNDDGRVEYICVEANEP